MVIHIVHSPFSLLHGPQRGVTPFFMEKLSYWLLFFLILHSLRKCDNPYYVQVSFDKCEELDSIRVPNIVNSLFFIL